MSELDPGIMPKIWSRMALDRLKQDAEWAKLRQGMMPYAKGGSWRSSLNRFVSYLNSEHERKLHPERYYE